MKSVHAKTIAVLCVQQRLLGIVPWEPDWHHDQAGSMYGRIRITEELIQNTSTGPFIDAMREEIKGLAHDAATHAWVKP